MSIELKSFHHSAGDDCWDVYLDGRLIGYLHNPVERKDLHGKFYYSPVNWQTASFVSAFEADASSAEAWKGIMRGKLNEPGADGGYD